MVKAVKLSKMVTFLRVARDPLLSNRIVPDITGFWEVLKAAKGTGEELWEAVREWR